MNDGSVFIILNVTLTGIFSYFIHILRCDCPILIRILVWQL